MPDDGDKELGRREHRIPELPAGVVVEPDSIGPQTKAQTRPADLPATIVRNEWDEV